MGFYSIYKILKDIIRTLFGNKFLKTLLIVLIIFLFITFYNKCFAVSEASTITIGTATLNVPAGFYDKFPYLCIYNTTVSSSGTVRGSVCVSSLPVKFTQANGYLTISSDSGVAHFLRVSSGNVQSFLNQFSSNDYNSNTPASSASSLTSMTVAFANYDVVFNDDTIYEAPETYIQPELTNTLSELENLSFNDFIINCNSFTQDMINNPDEPIILLFYNRSLTNSSNTDGLYPIKEKYFYKESIYFDNDNSTDSNYIFKYPIFHSGVFFNIGSTYEIRLAKRVYIQEYNTWGYEYFENSYTFTVSSNVTQDYINQLNQQTATTTDQDNQQQQLNAINNQTQSIDNINNSITDSTVDNSSIDLPIDNTNDPTQSGVDNIFQTIYNSFTSGTAQDIVFPIPNTNKNITLSASYVSDSLRNNDASWVIDIIQAFYWYIISRYIIVDIMQKVRKIKQGNLENIENTNIKEDML